MITVKNGVTGELIGTVELIENWQCRQPKFNLKNEHGEIALLLKTDRPGSCVCEGDNGISPYQILTPDGTNIGEISKYFCGILINDLWKNSRNYGATFPIELDTKLKAILLGAIFLIVS